MSDLVRGVVNFLFVALGYRQVGARFAIKSAAAIAGLSLCLALVHPLSDVHGGITKKPVLH